MGHPLKPSVSATPTPASVLLQHLPGAGGAALTAFGVAESDDVEIVTKPQRQVFFYQNGHTAHCVGNEQQPDLQKSWLLLYVAFLESQGIDPAECEFHLPAGNNKAKLFRTSDGGWNWEIVRG